MTISKQSRDPDSWIQTYTGRAFYPTDPRVDDVCIDDIAHALANICRFTGHTKRFYSVAQHSVICSLLLPKELMFEGLMHDAPEAYLLDLARPVKYHSAFAPYRVFEDRVSSVIRSAFGMLSTEPDVVKVLDKRMLSTERRDLMKNCPVGHSWQRPVSDPFDFKITAWPPTHAKRVFLAMARMLRPKDERGMLPAWGSFRGTIHSHVNKKKKVI